MLVGTRLFFLKAWVGSAQGSRSHTLGSASWVPLGRVLAGLWDPPSTLGVLSSQQGTSAL